MGRVYRTSDGVEITPGLCVWTNNLTKGVVDDRQFADGGRVHSEHFDGWFEVRPVDGGPSRSRFDGSRLTTRHPFTGEPAGS